MQKIAGYARKAIAEYSMIAPGDHIVVGVSGGKDSLALLCALRMLRDYLGISYRLSAVTLDPCFGGVPGDYSPVAALCGQLGVPYLVRQTQIAQVIFEERKEANPCSLCARMRRGALHDLCRELQANKLALGHNWNDAVETFVMNLFGEGRLGCFSPVTWLSRKQLTVIRPLIYAPEKEIIGAVRAAKLPVVSSLCPADKHTNRQQVKEWLAEMDRCDHSFSKKLFGAMKRARLSDW
ncbi:MAG: tRNA 2-thiocytidine(32) synthetase TtcA [Provencibacterium sp.]|nr:tRNA 2-thiocytidine(32) synthetase TtcA [Provencibacterium sp.]